MKTYHVTCNWTIAHNFQIEAGNEDEAKALAHDAAMDLDITINGNYLDDSFEYHLYDEKGNAIEL